MNNLKELNIGRIVSAILIFQVTLFKESDINKIFEAIDLAVMISCNSNEQTPIYLMPTSGGTPIYINSGYIVEIAYYK